MPTDELMGGEVEARCDRRVEGGARADIGSGEAEECSKRGGDGVKMGIYDRFLAMK